MPVIWRFEGFVCGARFWTKRVYLKEVRTGLTVYPSSAQVNQLALLVIIIRTDYPEEEREFLNGYVFSRFIAAAMDPGTAAAELFLRADPHRTLQGASMVWRAGGFPGRN